MSDVTDILSAMGSIQASTQQQRDAVDAQVATGGGRQRTGGGGISLNALSSSLASATVGSAFSATIGGRTAGSSLALTGAGAAGLSLSGTTVSGTPTVAGAVNIVETLSGATNSPRTTSAVISVADAAADTPSAFTMTQVATPNRIYQRTAKTGGSGAGTGPVPVTLNVTKAGAIYARTRSTSGANPVVQPAWKAVDNAPVASGPVSIPGVNATVDEFFLDLSPDGVTWQNGTVPIGMGKLILYAGQSLIEAMIVRRGDDTITLASLGETPTTAGRISSAGGAWQAFGDGAEPINSAGFNALVRLQAAKEGCRIGMVGYAQGATDIAFWLGANAGATKVKAALDATGNRVEAAIWWQGHSDSAVNSTTGYYYRKQLAEFFAAVDSWVTDATFTRFVSTIPNISSASWGPAYKKETLRIAGQRWCEENPRAVSVVMDDLALSDGTHELNSGALSAAITINRFMVDPATGPGAVAGAATYVGSTLTIPLTVPAGSGLEITGDLKTRLLVMPRGLRDPSQAYTLNNVTLGAQAGNVVPLILGLGQTVGIEDVDVIFYPKNDPTADGSAVILRNTKSGDGASYGRPVTFARPVRFAAKRDLRNLTNAAFSAGRWSGRQGLSAGYANIGLVFANWAMGYTIECWLRHAGATGRNIFLSPAGTFIAYNGSDLDFNGTAIAGLLPPDQWHHISYTMDSGVSILHVNGALVRGAPGSVPAGNNPPAAATGIRSNGNTGGFLPPAGGATISDVAVWNYSRYGQEAITVPTGPYTGNEPFLDHLWALNGDAADSVIR